jgi:glycosyltransferase involved in cell wall biosynthesis
VPEPPLVSVVIPAFDGERHVGAAIESALAQDWEPMEVVVVDDGSRDRTADVVRRYPVRYVHQANAGVAAARNTGLAAACGDWLAFLDQDDLWEPDKLAVQGAILAADPEVDYVTCAMRWFLEPGLQRPSWARPGWFVEPQPAYITSAILARRSAFSAIGGFDSSFVNGSDTDWMLRARDAGLRAHQLERVLVHHRLHAANGSWDIATSRREFARAMKQSLDRRRRDAG